MSEVMTRHRDVRRAPTPRRMNGNLPLVLQLVTFELERINEMLKEEPKEEVKKGHVVWDSFRGFE